MSAHTSRLTVVHIVSGDLWAGAEVAVFNLLNQLRQRPELTIMAIALNEGTLSRRLEAIGIETFVVPEGRMSATGLGLKEAKALVDGAPNPVKEGIDREEADKLKSEIEEAGGEVELK